MSDPADGLAGKWRIETQRPRMGAVRWGEVSAGCGGAGSALALRTQDEIGHVKNELSISSLTETLPAPLSSVTVAASVATLCKI